MVQGSFSHTLLARFCPLCRCPGQTCQSISQLSQTSAAPSFGVGLIVRILETVNTSGHRRLAELKHSCVRVHHDRSGRDPVACSVNDASGVAVVCPALVVNSCFFCWRTKRGSQTPGGTPHSGGVLLSSRSGRTKLDTFSHPRCRPLHRARCERREGEHIHTALCATPPRGRVCVISSLGQLQCCSAQFVGAHTYLVLYTQRNTVGDEFFVNTLLLIGVMFVLYIRASIQYET